jgi:D-alanine-D-alanine ligase
VLASATGTEKEVAKSIYRSAGIPVPEGVDLKGDTQVDDAMAEELVKKLGLPIFVKPAANGSSYGVSRVTSADELAAAVAKAGSEGDRVLVESCIEGTEISVPVIGNDEPHALPIIEIVTGSDFYDSKVKYEPSALHHVIPARLPEEAYAKAQELAVRAHKALGCLGASRSDFIVKSDGTPVILETNTIPGMTESSLMPDSARHDGIEFPELCRKFVEYALEAHAAKEK